MAFSQCIPCQKLKIHRHVKSTVRKFLFPNEDSNMVNFPYHPRAKGTVQRFNRHSKPTITAMDNATKKFDKLPFAVHSTYTRDLSACTVKVPSIVMISVLQFLQTQAWMLCDHYVNWED
uniref:Uncharacterized protein n=1 Tax=Glossina pallidipes TaxID=7398 RepID=A0A1A9Z2B0_GLOPL